MNIYGTVATVLHIGNIEFEEGPDSSKGGCRISKKGTQGLTVCANMLGLDKDELEKALVSRVMTPPKGGRVGTVIMVPLKVNEAQNTRDALTKAIYVKLFDYIVACINSNLIGILDIAGFGNYFLSLYLSLFNPFSLSLSL